MCGGGGPEGGAGHRERWAVVVEVVTAVLGCSVTFQGLGESIERGVKVFGVVQRHAEGERRLVVVRIQLKGQQNTWCDVVTDGGRRACTLLDAADAAAS